MSIRPVIGVDLGYRPAMVLATGTGDCPVLLAAKRWSRWDTVKICGQLSEWLERCPGAAIWFEETFTERRRGKQHRVKIDVGRVQEGQAGYLMGWADGKCEVKRVPPVIGNDPQVAWIEFGRPAEGKGQAGEHLRDALGVALKALNRQ